MRDGASTPRGSRRRHDDRGTALVDLTVPHEQFVQILGVAHPPKPMSEPPGVGPMIEVRWHGSRRLGNVD